MSTDTPARNFILPRLHQLVKQAGEQGIDREVAVAVLIDLVTGGAFNDTPLDPAEDSEPQPGHDVSLAQDQGSITERTEHPKNPLRGERIFRSDIRLGRRGYRL